MRLAAVAILAAMLAGPGPALADPTPTAPAAPPATAATPTPAAAPDIVTTVVGLTGKTVVVTPKLLEGLDRAEAVLINHGAPHTYEGVRLTELMRLVGAPTGARLHAEADRDYLVVTGGDGFRAIYSLAETDHSVQKHAVILADHMDGKPLDTHDAPFRLVVDGDQKPARSVYAVTKIEVKQLP
jgi:hypothetical protein